MARLLLSNANTFLPSFPSPSSLTSASTSSLCVGKQNVIKNQRSDPSSSPSALGKRALCISLITATSLVFSLDGIGRDNFNANAAILEADDDEELLEKVKRDRKKRLERQVAIKSAAKETAYLQDLVYRLSRVGQAIDNNDLSSASSVLGQSTDTDWVQKANSAFNKLSSGPEEEQEVKTFNTSIAFLISSVTKNDFEASKTAFVESASALEKWTTLTGLVGLLKGI